MSRTRLIRPAFFGDEEIAVGLTRDSRLAYAGLWTECDDAGYFEARPRQLARALFGYDDDGLEVVEAALEQLVKLHKVELLECGVHGVVPSLPDHAQQGGNKAFNHRDRHAGDCLGEDSKRRPRADPSPSRKTLSDQVRVDVVRRDQNRCRYCGVADGPDVTLIFDHVDNLGAATLNNIVQACRPCNVKKNHHGLAAGIVALLPPPVRTSPEQVRTPGPDTPLTAGPDKSRSESVRESESVEGARRKKNVLDETVVEPTARATPPAAPFLSDPPTEGRPDASEAVGPSRLAAPVPVPPRLEALTPSWRHVCTDYTRHQSFHRIVAGVAECTKCEEAIELAASNGTAPTDPPVSIWSGPVQ